MFISKSSNILGFLKSIPKSMVFLPLIAKAADIFIETKVFPSPPTEEVTIKILLVSSLSFLLKRKLKLLRIALKLRSEEHTSELQTLGHLVCLLLLENKN